MKFFYNRELFLDDVHMNSLIRQCSSSNVNHELKPNFFFIFKIVRSHNNDLKYFEVDANCCSMLLFILKKIVELLIPYRRKRDK